MAEIILHHYPPSPVAEKVRTALGLKQLAWHSVEENRLPDRPELFAMTGGYRRIPVMQIGSDIYCDTACILDELERRHPEPTLFPAGSAGLALAIARWSETQMFDLAVRISVASAMDKMPPAVVQDRARLYLGPDGDFQHELEQLPHTLAQFRAQLGWLESALAGGAPYLMGKHASLADLQLWTIIWFVRTRHPRAEEIFGEFPQLQAWIGRMEALGHGSATDMTTADALAAAASTEPTTERGSDPLDPQAIEPGMRVSIAPVTDSGDPTVNGEVLLVTRDRIALLRDDASCGRVVVHFPRVGYRVSPVAG
ncbi:glutathione S-transferase [Natronocella acetinitrilica]|uniref:Glutathione S-transferase n=1 Tax=Natronocella acetinitrilica TaxID=414046 RepID=A0AAE3G7A2_9GAMM|nr:glutathione S-transferase family protein [Natronocella acetinitrilica]MCP1677130.1 glutathione S-transferase [Natronocella acetinitrilica]